MTQWIVTSCVLVLAILCLRHLLKGRISLRLQYALWAVVLVRLLVPVTFGQSPLSAANLVQAAQPTVSKMEALEIPVQSFDSAYEEVVQEYIQQGKDVSGFENAEQLEYEAYERMEKLSLTQILTGIWIGGMALCFLALLTSNLHFAAQRRKRRRKVDISDCPLPVYADTGIKTPCLFGLFRPAVYVTEEVLADPTALGHVLAHEQSHYRHGDHLWAVLRGLCLCIHWYNPLVWVAAQISRRDAELACDERAIEKLGEENRLDYGRTLIGLTCAKDTSPLRTATMMTGSNHSIKERITLIAKKPAFSAAAVIILLLAVTLAVGCSFTGPVENPSKYDVYAFPGTEWAMTYEELMESLNLTEDDITQEEEDGYFIVQKEYEDVFGAPATVNFRFMEISIDGASYHYLDETIVIYADSINMELVRSNLIRQYGEPTAMDSPPRYNFANLDSSEGHVTRWNSDVLLEAYMTDDFTDYLMDFHGTDSDAGKANAEKARTYPAAFIWWTDDSNWMYSGMSGDFSKPGAKAVFLCPVSIDDYRASQRSGLLFPIRLPEGSYPNEMISATKSKALVSIFLKQAGAGIPITDAEIFITPMDTNVRNEATNSEILVCRIGYRLKPKTPGKVIPGENEAVENGWIVSMDTQYHILFHQMELKDENGGIIAEDGFYYLLGLTEEEMLTRYGTPEMLEEHGDMYTAAAINNCSKGFQIYPAE